MSGSVAAGFRCHAGWAVMVVVSGSRQRPVVHDRRRVTLVDEPLPRQPFHAVAEQGAPRSVVAEVEAASLDAATAALRSVPDLSAVGLIAAERRLPEDLDEILASHPRLHAAEGRLYERAVIDAATRVGLGAHVIDPARVVVGPAVEGLTRTIGPPWQKDHKWATEAALAALHGPPG